jgi:hypothetical protein
MWLDQGEIKWREKASYLLALSGEGNQRLERSFYCYDLLYVSAVLLFCSTDKENWRALATRAAPCAKRSTKR